MSQPIDELLIAVKIEEGSNLEELYEMLKEIRGEGGQIELTLPDLPNKQNYSQRTRAMNRMVKAIEELKEAFPEHKAQFEEILKEYLEDILTRFKQTIDAFSVMRFAMGEWSDELNVKINELEDFITDIPWAIGEILTENTGLVTDLFSTMIDLMGWAESAARRMGFFETKFEEDVRGMFKELAKVVREAAEEGNDKELIKLQENMVDSTTLIVAWLEGLTDEFKNCCEKIKENLKGILGELTKFDLNDLAKEGTLMSFEEDLKNYLENDLKVFLKESFFSGIELELISIRERLEKLEPKTQGIKAAITEYFNKELPGILETFKKSTLDPNLKKLIGDMDKALELALGLQIDNIMDQKLAGLGVEQGLTPEKIKAGKFELTFGLESAKARQLLKDIIGRSAEEMKITPEREARLRQIVPGNVRAMEDEEKKELARQFKFVNFGEAEKFSNALIDKLSVLDLSELIQPTDPITAALAEQMGTLVPIFEEQSAKLDAISSATIAQVKEMGNQTKELQGISKKISSIDNKLSKKDPQSEADDRDDKNKTKVV